SQRGKARAGTSRRVSRTGNGQPRLHRTKGRIAPSLREHAAAEVAQADTQEQSPERYDNGVNDVQMHMWCVGEDGAHSLVDVDQRVDQDDGLQPVPSADRD